MKKIEKIKRAYAGGMTNRKQLAVRFGTTEKYVAKVVREANLRPNDKRTLTASTYIDAIFLGITTVADLANFFNVSERTVIRFRNESHIQERLSNYFYVLNRPALLRKTTIEQRQSTLKDVCAMLQDICSIIEPLANDNKQAALNIEDIRQIITKIEQIKP